MEQIIKFELRGPGPPGRTCTPTECYFHDKAKNSKEYFQMDYYLLVKYCRKQYTLLPPIPGQNYLQNLTPKCKIINVFWT